MSAKSQNALLLILGNQLFPLDRVLSLGPAGVFMAEDQYLCSHFRYHQQKIVLVLAAMRAYADELRAAGVVVHYTKLDAESQLSINEAVVDCLHTQGYSSLLHFEIEGKAAQANLTKAVNDASISCKEIPSPMFLCDRAGFTAFVQGRKKTNDIF